MNINFNDLKNVSSIQFVNSQDKRTIIKVEQLISNENKLCVRYNENGDPLEIKVYQKVDLSINIIL